MARKKICPDFEPVEGGGSAPRCKAQHVCENFCFVEKCDPTGAQKAGLHEYDIDANCAKTNETWKDVDGATLDLALITIVACVIAAPVPPVEPTVPPAPITLDGQDCDGAANPATGMPGELVQIVQAPGQVLSVRFCSDDAADFELACGIDPTNDHQIQTAYKIVNGEFVLISRWDVVTGLAWTGDASTLNACGGSGLESDADDVCVEGTSLRRWTVKKDGVPTGDLYYTDSTGAIFDVPSTAVVVLGSCVTNCATLPIQDCNGTIYGYAFDASSAAAALATVALEDCDGVVYGYIFDSAGAGHTKPVYEGCAPDPEVLVGYAADIGCATDKVQESDRVDVCVDGVSRVQWVVKENGVPTGLVYYTDADGQLVEVASGAGVTLGSCDSADFELSCGVDPDTGHTIQTAYKIVAGQFVVINRWDVVSGLAWTGDAATLESCNGVTQESDPREVCVGGVNLTQWVVMEAGMPTGTVFYTNNAGQIVEVAPGAEVTLGACPVIREIELCLPTISSAFGNDLSSLLAGQSISIQKSNCCAIKVKTSAGDFIVSKDMTGYSTGDFNCPVTVDSIEILSGTCSLADIVVTTQKAG